MSTLEWIDDAAAAFEHALSDLIGERQPQLDPVEAGRRAALRAVSGAIWTDAVGPFYDTDGVMALLGGVSKQAVNDRVRRHRLLALRTGSGRLVYPVAQFDDERVVDGLGAVLDILVPDDAEAWMVASWLTTPDPALGGHHPLDALRRGDRDAVLTAARQLAATLPRLTGSSLMVDFPAPPDDLGRFPTRTIADGTTIFRIHHSELGPCWFSSFPDGDERAGRFDLSGANGSSYWALKPEAAFLETIARRPITVVPLEVVDRFRLSTVRLPDDIEAANTPVKLARSFGLTGEFHATSDYAATRRWAEALFRAGHRALVSIPRHDVTGRLRSLTLFGRAGEHVPRGWRSSLATMPLPVDVIDSMAEWGIRCLPIPFDVDTL